MQTIKDKLIHALTQYDIRQSKQSSYNPYALGHYFARIDDICADIERGADPRKAILAGFSGRLLDVALRACGFPISTKAEQMGNVIYESVTK